jgi:hypothetical protein
MENSVEKVYEYKLKRGRVIGVSICIGAFAVLMGYFAATNDRGIRFTRFGSSTLSPEQATIFLWGLSGFLAAATVLFVVLLIVDSRVQQRIAFAEAGLLVPRSFYTSREKQIAYDDIRDIVIRSNNNQRWLEIEHNGVKSQIHEAKLPNSLVFDELVNLLAEKVRNARNA